MNANYRVVVGVDGSDGGRRALRWAIHEAAAKGGTVQAINAWRWDTYDLPSDAPTSSAEERARAEDLLNAEIESIPDRRGVTIAAEAVEGRPAEVLSEAANDADLLVVGSHGHSQLLHTVLGSVSEECVRRATCPVVVLPVGMPEHLSQAREIVPASGATASRM